MQDQPTIDTKLRNKNRRLLVIISLAFLAPVILSWLAIRYGDWSVETATSRGTLVHPARPVSGILLQHPTDPQKSIDSYRGKWTLVYAANEPCAERCLQLSRNINITRLALGEEAYRVQGLVVLPTEPTQDISKLFAAELPNIHLVTIDAVNRVKMQELFRWEQVPLTAPEYRVYLLDPLGNLMMLYEDGSDPKSILQDLRKLLKASRIG